MITAGGEHPGSGKIDCQRSQQLWVNGFSRSFGSNTIEGPSSLLSSLFISGATKRLEA
jgi:hypothetical protein